MLKKKSFLKFFLRLLEELVSMFFYLLYLFVLIFNELFIFPLFKDDDLNMGQIFLVLLVVALMIWFALLKVELPYQDKISKKFDIWKKKKEKQWGLTA